MLSVIRIVSFLLPVTQSFSYALDVSSYGRPYHFAICFPTQLDIPFAYRIPRNSSMIIRLCPFLYDPRVLFHSKDHIEAI